MQPKFLKPPVLAASGDRGNNRPPRQKHHRLDDDDKLLILHGMSKGWTVKEIALTLPASQTTVKNFRAKIFEDTAIGVRITGMLVEIAPKVRQCRLCAESRGSRAKAIGPRLARGDSQGNAPGCRP
jgi:hypothetical protein